VFLHIVFTHQLKQGGQLHVVVHGQSGTQTDTNITLTAEFYGMHRGGKATFHLSKLIVNFWQTINADADIIKLSSSDLLNIAFVDQRAVGREGNIKTVLTGALSQLENI